jgi:hypothetical protein
MAAIQQPWVVCLWRQDLRHMAMEGMESQAAKPARLF